MTEYLKLALLPSWWQKLELKDLSKSELFEELLSWNLEYKLITPNYITGTYFGYILAILDLGAGPLSRSLPLVSLYLSHQ